MPRKLRIEYPGAIYHVMNRGDRREDIFLSEIDRRDFIKTLGEACEKTGWQVHAYCLMGNHFHLVLETPEANLVSGMRWLLSTYTIRFNHRNKLFGHVFAGRYKSQIIDGSGNGYLRIACDYVHLNPVRAKLLRRDESFASYPWSSLQWFLTAPKRRPSWIRVDRLFGEHGIQADNAKGRQQFQNRMEKRRAEEDDQKINAPLRRGWLLGSEEFRKSLLLRMQSKLSTNHAGKLRREWAEAKADTIIEAELAQRRWTSEHLLMLRKHDPEKLKIAARLRRETVLPMKWIAARLHLGTSNSANVRVQQWLKNNPSPTS
jgi:putative transposase